MEFDKLQFSYIPWNCLTFHGIYAIIVLVKKYSGAPTRSAESGEFMNTNGFVNMWYPSYRDPDRKWKVSIAAKIRYVLYSARKYKEMHTKTRWEMVKQAHDRLNGALETLADMDVITREENMRISRVVWKTASHIMFKD